MGNALAIVFSKTTELAALNCHCSRFAFTENSSFENLILNEIIPKIQTNWMTSPYSNNYYIKALAKVCTFFWSSKNSIFYYKAEIFFCKERKAFLFLFAVVGEIYNFTLQLYESTEKWRFSWFSLKTDTDNRECQIFKVNPKENRDGKSEFGKRWVRSAPLTY